MDDKVLFFNTPQEVWNWIDTHPQPGSSGMQGTQHPLGPRRKKGVRPWSKMTPSGEESKNERRRAMEAVAHIRDSHTGSLLTMQEARTEDLESVSASNRSDTSSTLLPHVTPGTADYII
ncbi:hypothetical protein NDU88_002306 [Pleurodeles waltl]|uniref:Uncharacterized protein n=1 Tax=Pleurodeles waltl TaxID=8319 RepID=A0AAV7M300_PLEWA|nr:hypothetical protein NDU88_002306 [Pleurodeles waltl]